MGLAVRSAARVEGVRAEVARCVFECDEGAGTYSQAPRTPGLAQGAALHSCALDFTPPARKLFLLQAREYRRCTDGRSELRSVWLGAIHACVCPPQHAA